MNWQEGTRETGERRGFWKLWVSIFCSVKWAYTHATRDFEGDAEDLVWASPSLKI